ncbi:helix-turn-helix domain-containing protein [Candidatus Kuenenbacteria bacterium]|nr:helix-turn-helix domain-containing protein [Candidatus Kuenenbacteria bacterium]
MEINPNEVYTTEEAQDYLKISNSTIKRLIKGGILKAHKVGGRYRLLGKDVLRAVSPEVESRTANVYLKLKKKVKKTIENW